MALPSCGFVSECTIYNRTTQTTLVLSTAFVFSVPSQVLHLVTTRGDIAKWIQ